jgi:PIN domain nuclease of toxin-antitoxin system
MLDTHVLLWWLRDNPRLGARTRSAIASPHAQLFVSIASFWELSIKHRIGKMPESGSHLFDEVERRGLNILGVTASHLAALENLERIDGHNDPFDHLIVAQAKAEQAVLLTSDKHLLRYGLSNMLG